jgi:hypothetical protein
MDELKQQLADARAQDVRLVLMVTLALGIFLLLFGLDSSNLYDSDRPPIGTVFPDGSVRYRAGRSLEWNDVDSEFPVYQRDSIFTPAGSSATIELTEGGTISLKPNTLVKLIDLGSRQTDVELVFGEAKGATAAPAVPVDNLRNMIYACQRTGDVKRLSGPAVEGGVPVLPPPAKLAALPPKPVPPRVKPIDKLEHFGISILVPANKSTIPRTSLWVGFNWSPVPVRGVKYELEVSRDLSFKTRIGSKDARPGELLLVNLPGEYYARVKARVGKEVIESPASQFTMLKVGARAPATGNSLTAPINSLK